MQSRRTLLRSAVAAGALAALPATGTTTAHAAGRRAPYAGYLFTYFTGEGTADGEQIRFALSDGNDPLHWRELNGGAPVLVSGVGERGVRDPFILRSSNGRRFYQIATDLRIYGSGDWDGAQRHGSRSIVVWESADLVRWSAPRLARVAPEAAGNTWAPEATYDPALGAYVVYWASKLYDNAGHTGDTYNRMLYATTKDFRTFTDARVWIDRGWSVIDSTVIRHEGTYHRISKDERSADASNPYGKFVFQERSSKLTSTSWQPVREGIGYGAMERGEGPLVFKSNTEEKWYLFIDEYGGRGYLPFETTDLAAADWKLVAGHQLPASPRHGTVLPVTAAEYTRLDAAFG